MQITTFKIEYSETSDSAESITEHAILSAFYKLKDTPFDCPLNVDDPSCFVTIITRDNIRLFIKYFPDADNGVVFGYVFLDCDMK